MKRDAVMNRGRSAAVAVAVVAEAARSLPTGANALAWAISNPRGLSEHLRQVELAATNAQRRLARCLEEVRS